MKGAYLESGFLGLVSKLFQEIRNPISKGQEADRHRYQQPREGVHQETVDVNFLHRFDEIIVSILHRLVCLAKSEKDIRDYVTSHRPELVAQMLEYTRLLFASENGMQLEELRNDLIVIAFSCLNSAGIK